MLRDKVTEFYLEFTKMNKNRPKIEDSTMKRRNRAGKLTDSEMMSIYLLFQFGQFTNFKHFYLHYVCKHLNDLFINLISYERFNARQERILLPLMMYLKYKGLGKSRGITTILTQPY